MDHRIKVNFTKIICTVEAINGKMVAITMENGRKIKWMDRVYTAGTTEGTFHE